MNTEPLLEIPDNELQRDVKNQPTKKIRRDRKHSVSIRCAEYRSPSLLRLTCIMTHASDRTATRRWR